ncbi:13761_t:CDS:2, partial [Gigaspora margarita]
FISARELIETNTIPNTSNSNEHDSVDRTEDNIQKYIKKSKIKNTDACTQKWVRILQNYRKKKNIVYDIQSLTNKEQLEHELCEFFADIKRQDELQDQGHGEIVQSKGLSQEEIRQILLYLNSGEQSALRLTWKVFFWNAYLLGLRGGDHYRILLNSFDFQLDGSLIFTIGREKNNPGGLNGRNKYGKFSSRNIHIPADLPNNEFKP